eukprot:m.112869 g.112869  ORF g.112869 m.112869 type:complete len:250 (-) comp28224_c1_seq1:345-1094(-)
MSTATEHVAKRAKLEEPTSAIATDEPVSDPVTESSATETAKTENPYLSTYLTPEVPPQVEQADSESKLIDAERVKLNIKMPPRNYGPADTRLWTKLQAEMFRAKKQMHDIGSASQYMRWWFAEHAGYPCKPNKAPRSAYNIYSLAKIIEAGCSAGNKKELRKIGIAWKAMGAEEKSKYTAQLEVEQQQCEDAYDDYDNKRFAWRKQKRERLIAAGEMLSNTERSKSNKPPICNCDLCEGDDHATLIADP